MRACWLKWVGRDWSISADYIWLNYSGANTLESNHDVTMLREGEYPRFLQERILSARGHLSNGQAAEAARGLVTDRTEQLIAMHISQENNRPSLTVKSYAKALAATLDDEVGSSATLLQGSRNLSIRPASQYRPATIQ